ncbi:MAG: hypothetical protein WAU70_11900 [Flavobacteriales bacterium]
MSTRNFRRALFCLVSALSLLEAGAQGESADKKQEAPAPALNNSYQGNWDSRSLGYSGNLLLNTTITAPGNALAWGAYFQNERNSALSLNNGSLSKPDKERLQTIADDMEEAVPGSFESDIATFYLEFPKAEGFVALDRAAAKDAQRTELCGPKLSQAAMSGNDQAMKTWSVALKERGGLAPPLLDVAADVLASVDRDAVVLANGEMDTYPLWVEQHALDLRTDVLVVHQAGLADDDYRSLVWKKARAEGAVPGAESVGFVKALAAHSPRPVYLAPSCDRGLLNALRQDLYLTGLAMRYSSAPLDNLPKLKAVWPTLRKNTQAGPLSRNYLLPAITLRDHYQAIGDEENYSRSEAELLQLAKSTDTTNRLYELGILKH